VDVRKYAKGACPREGGGFERGNEGRETELIGCLKVGLSVKDGRVYSKDTKQSA